MTASAEVPTLRIAYVGPGLGGKYTSLTYVAVRLAAPGPPQITENRAVLHAPDLTIELARIGGSRFQPEADERAIAIADGIVFVVDSQQTRWDANREWAERIVRGLARRGGDVPIVLSCTKRDFITGDRPSSPLPMEQLANLGAPWSARAIPCIATRGEGAWEAFSDVTIRVARARGLEAAAQAWLARAG